MPVKFTPAPEVETIARELIPDHGHLIAHAVRVDYVFRDDTPSRAGREVWGDCKKISNLNAYLAGEESHQEDGLTDPFFVITVSLPIWEKLDHKQRMALVDHELSHAWAEEDDEGNVRIKILDHDLEEFTSVYARRGAWRSAIRRFLDAGPPAAQLDLPLDHDPHRQTLEKEMTADIQAAGFRYQVRLVPVEPAATVSYNGKSADMRSPEARELMTEFVAGALGKAVPAEV